MSKFFHITYYKVLCFLKINTNTDFSSIIKTIGTLVVYSGFAFGAYVLTKAIFFFQLEQAKIGLFLSHRFIAVLLFIFFLSVNAGNIVVSYASLYRSKEMQFLISKPVSFIQLFIIKFFDNFFYSSTTLLLLLFAVTAGYIDYFNFSPVYYFIIPVFIIIPFMFTAASLGSIMLLLLMSVAIKIGIRAVIAILGTSYILLLISFFRITSPIKLVNNVLEYFPNVDYYFGFLESPLLHYLPNNWAAEALYWLARGNHTTALFYIYVQVIVSVIAFLIAVITAKFLFRNTYYKSKILNAKLKEKKMNSPAFFSFARSSSFIPQTEVLFKKEFWNFFREPSQWIHLTVMLFLIALFTSSIGSIRFITTNDVRIQSIVYLTIFLFNSFLIASLALRFVFPLISIEGEAFWKILSSPVSNKKFLFNKFIVPFIFMVVISIFLNLFANRIYPFQLMIMPITLCIFTTLTFVSINFGMGIIYSNFKESNPIRIASSQGATISFLVNIIYLVFLVVLLFNPVYRTFEQIGLQQPVSISYFLFPALIIIITSITVSYLFIYTGYKKFIAK